MLIAAFAQYFFGMSIFVSSIFLVMLVLVQRGRGGGLTGALGGPGGQSAFGTKAGDLFTRITVGVAAVWIVLCASSVFFLKSRGLPTLGAGTSNTAAASGTIESSLPSDGEALDESGAENTSGSSVPTSGTGLDLPAIDLGGTNAADAETESLGDETEASAAENGDTTTPDASDDQQSSDDQ